MLRNGTTTRSSWAAALGGSLGLHAVLAWAVSSAELSSDPLPRVAPLAVYLLPIPPEPSVEPLPEVAPETPPSETIEEPTDANDAEPEAARASPPPEPLPEQPGASGANESAEDAPRPRRAAPQRREIDWNASISHAIAIVREREQQGYRTFGFTMPEPDIAPPPSPTQRRTRPWESQRPGETISTGTDQVQVNENCYYEVYAPGSLLAEAHRFSNSSLSCKPNGPAEPRNDLFIEARPDYLDLHLAEERARDAQSAP